MTVILPNLKSEVDRHVANASTFANMRPMEVIADANRVAELIRELAEQISRSAVSDSSQRWAIVGIRNRGDILAERLAEILKPDHLGTLDITLYRDDLSEIGPQAVVQTTEIDFDLDGVNVVLVDDVLMSGRSVRAALQSLMDLGRPKRVWLGVLVDRGRRELPIAADFVGIDLSKQLADSVDKSVDVRVTPLDKEDAIVVSTRQSKGDAA